MIFSVGKASASPSTIPVLNTILNLKMKIEPRKELSPALLSFAAMLKDRDLMPETASRKKTSTAGSVNSATSAGTTTTSSSCARGGSCIPDLAKMHEPPANERLQRSRERNRIHARKTRQRKKEQMLVLTNRADELKSEQIRLKQCINEKNTASILVGLFASDLVAGDQQQAEDPRIEALLRRRSDDIPDAAMLPELPALILPGQHHTKKLKSSGSESQKDASDDGIDYDLLGKDRSKCTPAELDKIRRERNRMHAKRTRDRKRFFMEEMAEMCQKLEDENMLLQGHLDCLNGKEPTEAAVSVISPSLSSAKPLFAPRDLSMRPSTSEGRPATSKIAPSASHKDVTFHQISTLLEAASAFSSAISDSSSASQEGSHDSEDRDDERHYKRRRLEDYDHQDTPQNVPTSITTGSATAVGC